MLSKLIAYAPNRQTAIERMRRALDEYFIGGIKTNLSLFRTMLQHPDFVAARIDTGFLDRLLSSSPPATAPENDLADIAAVSAALFAATSQPFNGQSSNGNSKAYANAKPSGSTNWKKSARTEALRTQ
jgi:acetyl-CoA carboxylase biotin carboxylase subunit